MKGFMQPISGCLLVAALVALPIHGLVVRQDASPIAHPLPKKSNSTSALNWATAAGREVIEPLQGVAAPQAALGEAVKRKPRLNFLFMATDKISNWAVWKNFFKNADSDQYRAFVHCKTAECLFFAGDTQLLKMVRTVPSIYCTDLVSPMNQLLDFALNDDGTTHPRDKFIFVSDSSLPSKPFSTIYSTLTTRQGSDICVYPSQDWADVPAADGLSGLTMAIKAQQWMVLERAHAKKASALWKTGVWRKLPTFFKLNAPANWQAPADRHYGDTQNFGCLDEYWHMTAIFGTLVGVDKTANDKISYPGFTNSPILLDPKAGWQGTCDTFALWSGFENATMVKDGKKVKSSITRLYDALDADSKPNAPANSPAWWYKITPVGIAAIKNSDFLFIRKFVDRPQLVGGGDFVSEYTKIVLEDSS